MNLRDIAKKVGSYISSKTQDDEGLFRQGKFTPVQQGKNIVSSTTDNTGLFRANKFGVSTFTPLKALGDFSYNGGPTLKQAVAKLPEQAQQEWGQAKLVRDNPLLQKFAPKVIEPLATATELGPAAYMNTWAKGASTFARDTTNAQKAWDLLGVAGSLNPAYASKNLAAGPLGVGFNAVSNKLDKENPKSALENWKQGWQQGQEFQFHANPINQATGTLVNQLAKSVPFLQKFTDIALKSNGIQATDKLGTAVGKWLTTSGKKILRSAILETAVETPIWASMTKTDQETYVDALEREALQNLVMNTGMAGLSSIVDSRTLAPIVKKSIDTAATNYWRNSTSPEGIAKQGGYIDFMGNTVDGTDRTNRFNNLVDTYYKPNATVKEKVDAYAEIRRLAGDVFSKEKIKQLTNIETNKDPENLIMALSDTLNKDIKTNRGYQEPFTIRNLLNNKELQRGGMDLTDKTKVFPQTPDQPIKTGGEVTTPQNEIQTQEIKRVASNIIKNNPGTRQIDAEAIAKDVIEGRKFNQSQISPESKGIKTNIDTRKVELPDQLQATKLQTELPKSNKVLPQDIIPTKNSSPEEVAKSIPKRLDNFIEKTLGYSTKKLEGGTREASGYTKALRGLQENISTKVETGMASENKLVRGAATTLQNFFRGLGMSPERQAASMSLRGEMGVANERAFNVMDTLYKSLGNDKASLERINAVLDPNISKIKVTFDQLNPTEKQVYGLIREGLDLVHDTSYANGHISAEVYSANKGKYTPRLYEVTEIPAEVNKFVTQGKKIVNDLYKQRKDIDAWKQDNSLNDPVYALGKRLSQVETNSAIKKYTDFLASNPRFISDIERPGFTKLSDSPAYGNLSGKYVLNSAAEDLKGFFFTNQGVQNLYDAFRSYDRLPIRQLQKKLLTVFNPTTNVGNIVSDQVFGWVTGVNPLTLNKNVIKLKTNPSEYKQINDYLMKKGITGTDITRTDFVNKLGSIDDLANGVKPGKIKLATDKIQSFYGGTDDVYKAAAFKSLLDKGFSLEEATRKVADGFQNYANVGKFYDLAAKTPIIGKPFIKFQGDLMRIIKNGAVNNPLGLISFLGILKGISYLSSKASGESDEDRKTRETRFAAPIIPGLNIPLTWQTPIGEINVARYISPFYANNETTNIASNMFPFIPNIDTKKDVASNVAMNVNDPLVSPLVQLAVNRDFRGKPISDPNENKYQPSNLTPEEKIGNQAKFLGRSYLPPPVNSAIDVNSAMQGKPNMYGTPQTVGQSVARLGGVKISQYGPEEVQKIRDKDAEYQQYKNESLDKQIISVLKQEVKGDITAEQSAKRIQNLEKQKKDVVIEKTKTMDEKKKDIAVDLGREKVRETGEITEVQGVVLYPDKQLDTETGEYKTVVKSIDLSKPINKPKLTGNKEVDKKMTSSYNSKITSRINDIVKLVELEKLDADTAEKMIAELKKTKIGGTKKAKKITFKTSSHKALPKITLKISSPVSKVKLKSAPKVGLTKTNNRKYTIKA